MSKRDIKRLLILNLPYLILGLIATNFGEAWRLAEGADSSAKILGFLILCQWHYKIHSPVSIHWICW